MKIEIINKLEKELRENGPSILTGLGIVGLVSTVGLAIKATHDFDKEEHKTKEEKFKSVVKHYWPVVVMGAGSIGCIIGSNKMNMKRNLALAGALKISGDKVTEYKDKWFGNAKDKNESEAKQNVIIFGGGDVDCYDQLSGRYFRTSLDNLRESVDNINRMLYGGDSPELEDFYTYLDLDSPEICEGMRWCTDDGPIRLVLSSKLDDKSKAILVVDFDIRPTNTKTY